MSNRAKKRRSLSKKKAQSQSSKKLAVRFSSPQIVPLKEPSTRAMRSKTLRSAEQNDFADDIEELEPISLEKPSSKTRAKTIGHTGDTPTQEHAEYKLMPTRTKSAKSVHNIDYQTDYKKKYEALNTKNHDLNRKIRDYEWTINNLQKELKKSQKSDSHQEDSSHFHRTIKHKEKEIANLRQRLKLAINDYEKVYGYYSKKVDLFKKKQQHWLNEQRMNERDVTKYVFADDIKRVKVRKKGLRVYFGDGEDVVFENIEVLGGTDYNDDDLYRNLVKKVKEEPSVQHVEIIETLDDDDMIILCLNELNARIRDFKHSKDEQYAAKIQERHSSLPLYHIDDMYLNQLKTNNGNWMKLFRKLSKQKKEDASSSSSAGALSKKGGGLGSAFFSAQKEMKSGAQPTICVQNNVILNNINQHKKAKHKSYAKHLQEKVDHETSKKKHHKKMEKESINRESDEDIAGLQPVSVGNGWFTAQIEMTQYNQQPSVCIKNKINLKHIQKKKSKFKLKKKIRAKTLQKRLNEKIYKKSAKNGKYSGHSARIAMDKGDSSEEDENGDDIYNMSSTINGAKPNKKLSSLMSGWFSAQLEIATAKQPTICVQNNVFLNNIATTKEQVEYGSIAGKRSNKKRKKGGALSAAKLQKKLNENTSNGLSKNTLDLSDDEDDDNESYDEESKSNDIQHNDQWYYKNPQRANFINGCEISSERSQLLLEIGVYLNRLLPTSIDYDLIKHYLPIFNNVYDIMAALFDGVLIAVLLNFLDDDLIDLRAINVAENKYPISKEQVIENLFVIKMAIVSLDLREFPDFEIDFNPHSDDQDAFCWYNAQTFCDILLLIVMHQFSGLLNKKLNVVKYPQLFRLCQNRLDKKCAQKTSCKEWLHRWIVFVRNPKMSRHDQFLSIDLGSYESPVASGNISWDTIRVLPQKQKEIDEIDEFSDEKENNKRVQQLIYVWNTDRRDFSQDIVAIHSALGVSSMDVINTIALKKDIDAHNNNYLMQLVYLSDLFLFNSNIDSLSQTESQVIHDYIHRAPHIDQQIIAWINSFHILDDDSNYQYIDNLSENIADGLILLHLLDAVKPGCVDWKNSGIRRDVRHKFDKLTNCNIVKQICDDAFRDIFHLVGMGGNDIVDGSEKYIRSLLLQIQRHHSTKLMASILFKKKAVSDDELLRWMNNRLKVYKQMVAAMNKMHRNDQTFNVVTMKRAVAIKSFEDKDALADAINFCNVISSINPKWINYQFVHDEIACKQEKYKKIQNAKYLITTLRRLGTDSIFITPKQFVQCQSTSTISISTAIITLAAKYNEYDQLALFHKNLKEIKAKMQKK